MTDEIDIVVVGCGVIGLTTGIVLREAGFRVTIATKEKVSMSASVNAGAIWGPFLSDIDSRVLSWSFQTLKVFQSLSEVQESGVEMVNGLGAADFETTTPDWILKLDQPSTVAISQLPPGYVCGWTYSVPIIDMPNYLEYLERRFERVGGNIIIDTITDLDSLKTRSRYIINCAGLGARDLARDETVIPCKGQLVVLENPGIKNFFAERGDGPELTYILPQGTKVVLGGTAEWNYQNDDIDQECMRQIIERCAKVEPRLLDAKILGYRVGIRPCRPTIRLEREGSLAGARIIHNYGHGGSGVSLSWACSMSVLDLIKASVRRDNV